MGYCKKWLKNKVFIGRRYQKMVNLIKNLKLKYEGGRLDNLVIRKYELIKIGK